MPEQSTNQPQEVSSKFFWTFYTLFFIFLLYAESQCTSNAKQGSITPETSTMDEMASVPGS